MAIFRSSRLHGICLCAALFLLSGCQRAPSVDILGSFFPIWIFCIILGIVLTVLVREALIRFKIENTVGPRLLVYPCMALLFAFSTWLIFFK